MADIEPLVVFGQTGERNLDGLDQGAGFPSAQKPARQWFNQLLFQMTGKTNQLVERSNSQATDFSDLIDQNSLEHANILGLILAANEARQNGDDYLAGLVDALSSSVASLYPKTIASGVLNQPTGGARSMLSSTDGWDVSGSNIVNTLGVDLTNVRYSLAVTPEGSHEAWNIGRLSNGFSLSVFNRSGTSRIGYNGNVSWTVTETTPSNADEGNGSYGAGVYSFYVYPSTSKLIRLWGGGGGGGASEFSDAVTSTDATNGQRTQLTASGATITANGGTAGTNGTWANGSAYSDGTAGAGGTTSFSGAGFVVSDSASGAGGGATTIAHAGGTSGRFGDYGRGGNGADGVGDDGYSFGGGGGEGGYIEITYTNSGSSPVLVRIEVGAGGDEGTTTHGNNGAYGHNGFATVANAV